MATKKTKVETGLNALQTIALAKSAKNSGDLAVGEHNVDYVVHIYGTVTKGEEYERTPTVKIPLLATLMLYVQRSGALQQINMDLLRNCMIDSLKDGNDPAAAIKANIKDYDVIAAAVEADILSQLPKDKVAGPTTAKLNVQMVMDYQAIAEQAEIAGVVAEIESAHSKQEELTEDHAAA